MVGVGHKPDQKRIAEAIGTLQVKPETIRLLKKKALPKGDVLTVAQIAGIHRQFVTSSKAAVTTGNTRNARGKTIPYVVNAET